MALILIGTFSKNKSVPDTSQGFSYGAYTSELEEKIEKFLLKVDGIKNAEVILTLDTSSEKIYTQDKAGFDLLSSSSSNGQGLVCVSETYPVVRGIAISCTNGDDDVVRMKITRLISAYLGISSNRIEIVNFG